MIRMQDGELARPFKQLRYVVELDRVDTFLEWADATAQLAARVHVARSVAALAEHRTAADDHDLQLVAPLARINSLSCMNMSFTIEWLAASSAFRAELANDDLGLTELLDAGEIVSAKRSPAESILDASA